MKSEGFIIKAYLKVELAMLYHSHMSPEGALRKMKRWINRCQELKTELERLQVSPSDHQYTPKQVALLVKHFGEPYRMDFDS